MAKLTAEEAAAKRAEQKAALRARMQAGRQSALSSSGLKAPEAAQEVTSSSLQSAQLLQQDGLLPADTEGDEFVTETDLNQPSLLPYLETASLDAATTPVASSPLESHESTLQTTPAISSPAIPDAAEPNAHQAADLQLEASSRRSSTSLRSIKSIGAVSAIDLEIELEDAAERSGIATESADESKVVEDQVGAVEASWPLAPRLSSRDSSSNVALDLMTSTNSFNVCLGSQ